MSQEQRREEAINKITAIIADVCDIGIPAARSRAEASMSSLPTLADQLRRREEVLKTIRSAVRAELDVTTDPGAGDDREAVTRDILEVIRNRKACASTRRLGGLGPRELLDCRSELLRSLDRERAIREALRRVTGIDLDNNSLRSAWETRLEHWINERCASEAQKLKMMLMQIARTPGIAWFDPGVADSMESAELCDAIIARIKDASSVIYTIARAVNASGLLVL